MQRFYSHAARIWFLWSVWSCPVEKSEGKWRKSRRTETSLSFLSAKRHTELLAVPCLILAAKYILPPNARLLTARFFRSCLLLRLFIFLHPVLRLFLASNRFWSYAVKSHTYDTREVSLSLKLKMKTKETTFFADVKRRNEYRIPEIGFLRCGASYGFVLSKL